MDEIGLQPTGALGQNPSGTTQPSIRPDRMFQLIPVGGFLAFVWATSVYRPVDYLLVYFLGGISWLAVASLISHVHEKSRRGEDVSSFFPMIYWLALAPAVVGLALWVNGAMDHHPVESHREVIVRTFQGRRKGDYSYYVEFTSWRAKRSTEEAQIPYWQYQQFIFLTDAPIIVEIHPGALGIAWFGEIRMARRN
jgi:hypothetical protein